MRIGRFQIFKKDLNCWNSYHSIKVLNKDTKEEFVINHTCNYMFYSMKEVENIVFNIFKKALELLNKGLYIERVVYFNKNNLTINYY